MLESNDDVVWVYTGVEVWEPPALMDHSPINGTASDVAGTDSATISEKTLSESNMVIPVWGSNQPYNNTQ